MESTHRCFTTVLRNAALWALSLAVTVGCLRYQDTTGPTYPLEGGFATDAGLVRFKFMRSETIGRDLALVLRDPVPSEIRGVVTYRRHKSRDDWTTIPLRRGSFESTRRGRKETIHGMGALLPSLRERAGKYEYSVHVDDGTGKSRCLTGIRPVVARYKGAVPMWALALHILAVFASMCLAIRTVLGAMAHGRYRPLLWATIVSLVLGGFMLGPLVQWYAFGVWWSGIPFGLDWTDNKVLVGLGFWIAALLKNRHAHNRRWVYLAGVATLLVYFIPHSIFGSEFDYTTGAGRGTAG